ncbi:hypothetical protein MUP01_04785 [Candidatus Bathyarchaeota archaeon]|nr:hypothetical protein [Candidatus Bathyarchaeota archaeon]
MQVAVKIASIEISKDQVVFSVLFTANGSQATESFNVPVSTFKGKATAVIEAALVEMLKVRAKQLIESTSEISQGAWIRAQEFVNKTFTLDV